MRCCHCPLRVVVLVTNRPYTIPITCCLDGQAHQVTDEDVAAGNRAGEYRALCGYGVWASPLAAPVGRPCGRCRAVAAAAQPAVPPTRRHLKWLRRALRRGRAKA